MRILALLGSMLLAATLVAGPATATAPAAVPTAMSEVSGERRAAPRLTIEGIGVDAGIIPTGVARDGSLDVKGSVVDVYRWLHGVRPGEPGSAVLAGHTWSKGDGVFDRLGELRRGDEVSVGRHRFVVTSRTKVRTMPPRQVAALYSDRGPARLVLITCGDRNAVTGVYATRIIVRARLLKTGK